MATLQIRLFGSLRLEIDGQGLDRNPGKRVAELFAFLLLNRDATYSREYVANLFWSDSDESKARRSLNTSLWRLQGIFDQLPDSPPGQPFVRLDARTVGFNIGSDYWLDVAEFESRCALAGQAATPREQAALYAQAVALYRADLLPDCYEDWCLIERERLQALYLRALARLVGYHSEQGEYPAAIEFARRILIHDPLREETQRDLIALHLAADQPTAALRQYRECEAILRRELGVEPMPETRALLGRALNAVGGVAYGPGRTLPQSPSRLTTAETTTDLREVAKLIDEAHAGLREAGALLGTLATGLGLGGEDVSEAGDASVSLAKLVRALEQRLGRS